MPTTSTQEVPKTAQSLPRRVKLTSRWCQHGGKTMQRWQDQTMHRARRGNTVSTCTGRNRDILSATRACGSVKRVCLPRRAVSTVGKSNWACRNQVPRPSRSHDSWEEQHRQREAKNGDTENEFLPLAKSVARRCGRRPCTHTSLSLVIGTVSNVRTSGHNPPER